MEQEESISSYHERGTSPFRNRHWLIAASVVIVFVTTASSLSTAFSVVSLYAASRTDPRDVDLSIALSRDGDKISDKFNTLAVFVEDNRTASPEEIATLEASSSTTTSASAVGDTGSLNTSECFPYNSHKWLTSKRIENVEGVDLAASFQILLPPTPNSDESKPQFQAALEETLCLNGSRFLTTTWENDTNVEDDKAVRVWTTRVVYLAVTFHQHYQAWEEFDFRRRGMSEHCRLAWNHLRVSPNDFECSNTKFLVIPLGDNGLGANFKLGAMAALKTSLASGRIALFINNFNHTSHRWLQKPWTLASCLRRDYQCFFMPPSPCVLTHEEYQNAHLLDKTEMRMLFRQGNVPHLDHERVIVYSPNFRPQREPPLMRDRLAKIGAFLVRQGLLPDVDIVRRAIARITEPADERRTAYVGDDELGGGLLLYVSRPQPEYLQHLQSIHESLFPTSKLSPPSVGLPIRGEC